MKQVLENKTIKKNTQSKAKVEGEMGRRNRSTTWSTYCVDDGWAKASPDSAAGPRTSSGRLSDSSTTATSSLSGHTLKLLTPCTNLRKTTPRCNNNNNNNNNNNDDNNDSNKKRAKEQKRANLV